MYCHSLPFITIELVVVPSVQVLQALRDIEKDEELLKNYGCGYWVSRGCTPEEERHLACRDRDFSAAIFDGVY